MADRFYVNCALGPGLVRLEGPEAHHLRVVCRLHPGDAVCLFNGDGSEYSARVTSLDRRGVVLQVEGAAEPLRELSCRLEVAAPLPKGDRAQLLLEKLTEWGVTDFVPLQTTRSVVHPRETRREKLQRYVIEASKQCGRNVLLRVGTLTPWADYCHTPSLPARRLLGHPGGGPVGAARQDTAIAVGPEGGFTEAEVEQARTAGWQLVGLGPRILRVETAALALAILAVGTSES
jgi:16S rRNA (uracil1498-N3)-methyltransferase